MEETNIKILLDLVDWKYQKYIKKIESETNKELDDYQKEDIKDVFLETLYSAYNNVEIKNQKSILAYFNKIIRFKLLDYNQEQESKMYVDFQDSKNQDILAYRISTKYSDIRMTLEKLLDEESYKIIRKDFMGYTNQEIADELGYSLKTIKRRISEVKEIIRNNEELFQDLI